MNICIITFNNYNDQNDNHYYENEDNRNNDNSCWEAIVVIIDVTIVINGETFGAVNELLVLALKKT